MSKHDNPDTPGFESPPSRLPWPPMLYGAALGLGFLAGFLVPLGMPFLPDLLRIVLGGGLLAVAFILEVWAFYVLMEAKTTVLPHRSSDALVTEGPFRYSRNPIYLGNTMLLMGFGMLMSNPWLIVTALAALLAVTKLAIEPEEAHLEERFGEEFTAYRQRTRRWL